MLKQLLVIMAFSSLVSSNFLTRGITFELDFDIKVGTNPTHYGNPTGGCMDDETPGKITGLDGDACLPTCTGGTCPTDVPSGTTAKGECIL